MLSLLAQGKRPVNGGGNGEHGVRTLSDLEGVFESVVGKMLGLAGIVLFIMILIGGFQFITAGDDPKKAESAKKTLTYAISGMVLIALAYLILRFIDTFTGVDVTKFKIFRTPTP